MLKSDDLKLIKFENAVNEHGNGKGTNSVPKFSLVSELLQSVCSVFLNVNIITFQMMVFFPVPGSCQLAHACYQRLQVAVSPDLNQADHMLSRPTKGYRSEPQLLTRIAQLILKIRRQQEYLEGINELSGFIQDEKEFVQE